MKRILGLLLLGCAALLEARLENHLREVPISAYCQTIRNIDFIYLINLDERPEKLKTTLDQLEPYNIRPYRFSAVNGWELSLETIDDIGLKFSFEMEGGFMATRYPIDGNYEPSHEILQNYGQTYFCHCMSRGAMGIVLSHVSILQAAYDAGHETIWVMEDDIEVIRDPRILSNLIDKLDQQVGRGNWDVLFTDKDIRDGNGNHKACYLAGRRPDFVAFSNYNDFAMKTVVGADFCKIGSRWGAHSMILTRSGIKKLLQFFKAHQVFFPYDMDYILPPGINLYAVMEDVVSNFPKASSDNGGPNYLNKRN